MKKNRQRRQKSYMFLWCHQCKQKHDDVVYCSRYFKGSCSKKYCVGCIQRHYGEDITDDNKESWVCLYCRNMCSCAFCRRRRGDETVPSEFGVSTVPRKAQKRKHHEIDEIKVLSNPRKDLLLFTQPFFNFRSQLNKLKLSWPESIMETRPNIWSS